ncbi:MAG: DUF4956 domain-containing protein [Bacteroidales bacterium]|nr:DUF4956 domain-containing protein [Bacteroidales bacterium]
MEITLFNWPHLGDLLLRFSFNMIVILILVRYLYYKSTRRKDYLFTYVLIAIVVFFICFLLEDLNIGLGFALGLFAIFGIIRYRTRQIPIREMTYLFMIIGTSVINALSDWSSDLTVFIFTNLAVILATFTLERVFLLKHESRKIVNYDKIENIRPENYHLLIRDIETRTGLKLNRAEVGRVDFLRDTARIFIYYYESENRMNAADDEVFDNDGDDD